MFARPKTGWIGFDIGATSVKAAQVVRTDSGCRIRAAAIVPRSQRWNAATLVEIQPVSSSDEISAAASLCDHLVGKSAATLLPAALCDLFQMDAPAAKRGDSADLKRAIEVETQRPARDRVYDVWPTGSHSGRLNVVTAPRSWSDRISADVAEFGGHCRAIDALPWALARAASLAHPDSAQPIAALDWAYGKSIICLVSHGVPVLVRSLKDCGYQSVVESIAKGLRMSSSNAESLLLKFGLKASVSEANTARPEGAEGVIDDLLQPPINHLVHELHRTFDYWRGVTRGQSPAAVYLFGGGGTLAGIGPRLTEQLGLPLRPWGLPFDGRASATNMPPACLLGAAVGLSALAWEDA
jgi:Tfp pilus assembly PilM family ATPase